MIRLNNINKFYKQGDADFHALKNFTIDIDSGEFVSIMGPSGSGKSTLINIIGFLDYQFEGEYVFNGQSVREKTAWEYAKLRNRRVGFVFQNFKLINNLSVAENVSLPLLYAGVRRKEVTERVSDVLRQVGLKGAESKLPINLSGGQQQRVSIARAVITKPSFLLADEPTGALDSHTSQEILQLFIDLNRNLGATVIMVTHNQHVANQSQRIIRILDGQIESDRRLGHETE